MQQPWAVRQVGYAAMNPEQLPVVAGRQDVMQHYVIVTFLSRKLSMLTSPDYFLCANGQATRDYRGAV